MTDRERFHETMSFGSPDRVPHWEVIGYWTETIERWWDEGLPPDVHLTAYFGLDRCQTVPTNTGLMPPFKDELISEDETTRVERGADGVLRRTLKKDHQSIPQFVGFPMRDRDSFRDFQKRMSPTSPARYPLYWDDYKRTVSGRDYPLGIHAGSIFGWLRNWMGIEDLALAIYDDRAWVQEMMEWVTDFSIELMRPALEQIPDLDCAFIWEDMCYRSGPLISPTHFKEMMVPQYKRITALLRKHGINIIMVDCDGNIDQLIPLWLEGGVNGVYPLEVAAGEDPVNLRKEYGKDLLMCGGIDKRELAKDRRAVEDEVMKKMPFLVKSGGWIPSIDHSVPPDVPLENYRRYIELLRGISGDR
jgi:uroporphyrinogen decarboxylase